MAEGLSTIAIIIAVASIWYALSTGLAARRRSNEALGKVVALDQRLKRVEKMSRPERSLEHSDIDVPDLSQYEGEGILEKYAVASKDVEMLTLIMQGMTTQDGADMTAQQALRRSVERAEREAELLRGVYEDGGLR